MVKEKDRSHLDKSELVVEQLIADQTVQLELITMLQETNLHTTVEYEQLMAELAKPSLAKVGHFYSSYHLFWPVHSDS